MRRSSVAVILALFFGPSAFADVTDSSATGFSLRHAVTIQAPREQVYATFVTDISQWWNGEHTVSGNAAGLYLEPQLRGCFCEALGPDAGLVHLTVTFVNPGVMLRLTGGLGPLGLMGVNGNMTLEFEDADDGTTVTLRYVVGGYRPEGLDNIAQVVDEVLVDQLARLKAYVEQGDPLAGR